MYKYCAAALEKAFSATGFQNLYGGLVDALALAIKLWGIGSEGKLSVVSLGGGKYAPEFVVLPYFFRSSSFSIEATSIDIVDFDLKKGRLNNQRMLAFLDLGKAKLSQAFLCGDFLDNGVVEGFNSLQVLFFRHPNVGALGEKCLRQALEIWLPKVQQGGVVYISTYFDCEMKSVLSVLMGNGAAEVNLEQAADDLKIAFGEDDGVFSGFFRRFCGEEEYVLVLCKQDLKLQKQTLPIGM